MKKWMHKLFSRSTWGLLAMFFAILFAILLIAEPIMVANEGWINGFLDIETSKKVDDTANETPDVMYYKPDFMQWRWKWNDTEEKYVFETRWNREGLYNYLNSVSKNVNTEGSVLLKNERGVLPLKKDSNVALYGISQISSNYITTGQGSGFHAANTSDNLRACLVNNGVEVNSRLYDSYERAAQMHKYSSFGTAPGGDQNYVEFKVDEAPFSEVEEASDASVGQGVSDNAVFIISRMGSENGDTDFSAAGHIDNNYMDLTAEEESVLEKLAAYKEGGKIDGIVLVLNTCNAMQFKTIAKYPVDSILWVGTGGTTSFRALADVLTGKADPNGRLADTYAYDNYSAPSTVNQGNFTYAQHSGVPATETYAHSTKYLVYQEGIYVGYKYYETRYEDMVMNLGSAVGSFGAKNSAGDWKYSEEVAYPFGYGSSYATFEQSDFKVVRKDDNFFARVTVTNVSEQEISGKDVFQLYIQKPYTEYDKKNGVEKAAVELAGFAKTRLLAKGESQDLEIKLNLRDFASYDAYGAGTYILEAGDYYLAAGKNSHDAVNNIIAVKGAVNEAYSDGNGNSAMVYKVNIEADDFDTYSTSQSGGKIENRLSDADINLYANTADQKIKYLSRSNWADTYPKQAVSMTCANAGMVADMQYGKEIPVDESVEMPVTGANNGLSLIQFMYEDFDNDELWDKLLDQLTIGDNATANDYSNLTLLGALKISHATSVNAPGCKVMDGPAGIRDAADSHAYPGETIMATTFNKALIEQLGEAFGMEMQYLGYAALYGPGANIHRNAFGGRNFEYFSEDGILSGYMLDAELKGFAKMGIITYTKHFVLNEQERNRYGVCVWANEQSIREIYLKAFQISIEDEDCDTVGLMTSFNRLGCTWSGAHKGLLTDILRGEWDFKGAVMTDAAVGGHMGVGGNYRALASAIVAGQTIWLGDVRAQGFGQYMKNPVVMQAIRKACKYNLYSQLRSSAMNGMKSGMRIVELRPWWKDALLAAQIISGFIACAAALMTAASFVLPKYLRLKNEHEESDGKEENL